MSIKQISKTEIEVKKQINDEKVCKKYILINSEEGKKLIKGHNLVIDPEMEEL